ncbi:MAG: hypothetical protein DVS81_07740 [Candidatus Accumulibacter meliphilus]|uniref:HigB toxin protein n=1 Tax=Candidatus Accumulibacter meliphilus TaxID=2211374 RepID=A0A369XUI0_9PROT|nr:MAG: hypothetical protein DVS81_07740 [Candidatus Accumulibacter meliphilus]
MLGLSTASNGPLDSGAKVARGVGRGRQCLKKRDHRTRSHLICEPGPFFSFLSSSLDTAQAVEDMDIPGFRLHPLKGAMRGRWSISVNGNWRLTFEFQDGNAYVLDYEDYH